MTARLDGCDAILRCDHGVVASYDVGERETVLIHGLGAGAEFRVEDETLYAAEGPGVMGEIEAAAFLAALRLWMRRVCPTVPE